MLTAKRGKKIRSGPGPEKSELHTDGEMVLVSYQLRQDGDDVQLSGLQSPEARDQHIDTSIGVEEIDASRCDGCGDIRP